MAPNGTSIGTSFGATLASHALSDGAQPPANALRAVVRAGDALRRRSVGARVPHAALAVPAPPARLVADWSRDIAAQLCLEPGDVEPLPLARTRLRWGALRDCEQALGRWLETLGLGGLADGAPLALMACRGARYHHDAAHYGDRAFCNLFLGVGEGLDLLFPQAGLRLPLAPGMAVLFDTAQPHAVLPRGADRFDAADFPPGAAHELVFLSWELPLGQAKLDAALGIGWEGDAPPAVKEPGLWLQGAPVVMCPLTGFWRDA